MPKQRKAKASEIIADHFRVDIATGKLRDGDCLPPEGDLVEHFGVSRPTLRAAYRILESEFLLTVSRGAAGGGRVRHPDVDAVARNVGLLLELRGTHIGEFFAVRLVVEPPAAAMLAANADAAVVARLEEILAEEAALLDSESFSAKAMEFSRAVTDGCGNEIVAVFGAVLQRLLFQAISYVRQSRSGRRSPQGRSNAQRAHEAHVRLVELVRASDVEGARQHWQAYVEWLNSLYPEYESVRFSADIGTDRAQVG